MQAFYAPVANLEEAACLLDALARYDIFQFENHIKPDYCNAGGLQVLEHGEWVDWYDDDGNDIDEWMKARVASPIRVKRGKRNA
jgi:hypothetical protein